MTWRANLTSLAVNASGASWSAADNGPCAAPTKSNSTRKIHSSRSPTTTSLYQVMVPWITETFSYYSKNSDATQYELFQDQRFRRPGGSPGYNKKQSPGERMKNTKSG
ncbi:MAG: hypothetical protein [Microviridae sp.]|nr:MAG: hypothetical protein [Microviridae sp.]